MKNGENFEFDKLMLALAFVAFCFIFASNFGDLLYVPAKNPLHNSYVIEITEIQGTGDAKAVIPVEDVDLAGLMINANLQNGEKIFKKCATCHLIDQSGTNKVGPNLYGIIDRKVATKDGFEYSSAMKAFGADGKVWDEVTLFRYIDAPKKHVPGTKMAFAGIKKHEEKADLLAYLKSVK